MTRIDGPWRHLDIHANGIRFHVVEAATGSDPGPGRQLVLLLHGFGSFWWSWRHQLRGLAGARVVAVDLRGYGGSDKPPRGYDGWTLAGDAAGLIRALGHSSATLVGHADGGLVCWATALLHPRLVRGIGLISSPHPAALRAAVAARADQRRALLPALLSYQVPRWPEHVLTRADGAAIEQLVRARSGAAWQRSADFAETVAYLRRAIQIPTVAHCALEYQRWAMRSQLRSDGHRFLTAMNRDTTIPVLHLRGDADPFILADSVTRTRRYAPHGGYLSIDGGVGHFGHEEAPEQVNEHLQRLLAGLTPR